MKVWHQFRLSYKKATVIEKFRTVIKKGLISVRDRGRGKTYKT